MEPLATNSNQPGLPIVLNRSSVGGNASEESPSSGSQRSSRNAESTSLDAPNERTQLLSPPNLEGNGREEVSQVEKTPFSRRKSPVIPAVIHLLEVMSTDLGVCGECFVLDSERGQTLKTLHRTVPMESDESLDVETAAFMGAPYSESYPRGIGLPGLAWTKGKPSVVEILQLARNGSFNPGGNRLSEAARLFHSALIVPFYSTNGTKTLGLGSQELIGVVVLYFSSPANDTPGLLDYAEAVVKSAGSISELMVQRSKFSEDRGHNPTQVRYMRGTGKKLISDARVDQMELGPLVSGSNEGAALQAPERQLGDAIGIRPQPAILMQETDELLRSREAPHSGGSQGLLPPWFLDYIKKFKGTGKAKFPPATTTFDAYLTWVGSFLAIAGTELVLAFLNKYVVLRGQANLFQLSGSFGALCTLLNAIPSTPLVQPRVTFLAHTLSMVVSTMMMMLFKAGEQVWFQLAFTVATAIYLMAVTKTIHPPAGALCLVILGAYNHGATFEAMVALFLSVLVGLGVHISLAVVIDNISPNRQYPGFW